MKKTAFDEIGGCSEAKEALKDLLNYTSNPSVYKRWGADIPKGILLAGVAGCGKTLLARAVAKEMDGTFLEVRLADIYNKYYGQSAANLQEMFESAEEKVEETGKPCIIFIDELDGIAGKRGMSTEHEESRRVMNTLLTYMDGIVDSEKIYFLGATNRVDDIDPAVLRPGRLDLLVDVPLPNLEDRIEIMLVHKIKRESGAGRVIFECGFMYDKPAKKMDGYSGADIAEVVRRACLMKAKEQIRTGQQPSLINTDYFCDVIKTYNHDRGQNTKKRVIGFGGK